MSSPIFRRVASLDRGACAPSGLPLDERHGRSLGRWLAVLGLALVVMFDVTPARAQGYAQPSGLGGFMQGLFGSSPPQPHYPQNPALQVYPPGPVARYPQSLPPRTLEPSRGAQRSSAKPHSQTEELPANRKQPQSNAASSLGGGLRTMCVRLCDGYYWPMTFDARRGRLDHDSKVCSASCTSEARAFVMPKSGEAKDMVDAQGRPYVKLANAFKYRKIPAGSCSCRPDPWDSEARARHEGFAEKSAAKSAADAEITNDMSVSAAAETGEPKLESKVQTMTDAEARLLSGGLVAAGSGLPASAVVVQAPPAEPLMPPLAVADTGRPQTGAPHKPVKTTVRKPRVEDTKRADVGRKPKLDHQHWATARPFSPHMAPPMPYSPARIIVPTGYGRQPYVIGQPQVISNRTY